jgi:Holliday junction DNA helicase RuvA
MNNMITKITGILQVLDTESATISKDGFEFEVLVPEFTRRQLQGRVTDKIALHTILYLDGNPQQGRLTPRIVGFLNPIERQFFQLFCSVDGVGSKKALRAMIRPVPEVARLIEEQDAKGLSGLPGIGPATAERIIAKLRRKMSRFALLVNDQSQGKAADVKPDIIREAYDVLRALGHSEVDAHKLVDGALAKKAKYKDVDSLIHAIYEQNAK